MLVVLIGVVLFTRAFLQAENPDREATAAAVFATFLLAAYVLARAGEKLSLPAAGHRPPPLKVANLCVSDRPQGGTSSLRLSGNPCVEALRVPLALPCQC